MYSHQYNHNSGRPPLPPRPGAAAPPLPPRPSATSQPTTGHWGFQQPQQHPPAFQGSSSAYHSPPPRSSLDPEIRDHGPPSTLLWRCPGRRKLPFTTTWYRLHNGPAGFWMCSRCHADRVVGTFLEGQFVPETRGHTHCAFSTPRARSLLAESQSVHDIRPIATFLHTLSTILPCRGTTGVPTTDGFKWYRPPNGQPDGFLACEACYHIIVLARNTSPWTPEVQPHGQLWSCDMPLVAEGYLDGDWVNTARKLMTLPSCEPGTAHSPAETRFTTRHSLGDFDVCQRCYLAHIAHSDFRHEFVQAPASGFMCDFSQPHFLEAFRAAKSRADFGLFQSAATKILNSSGELWMIDAHTDWDVCGKCYAGIIEPLNMGRYLSPRHSTHGRACDMCSDAGNGETYRRRIVDAAYYGAWSYFADFVRQIVTLPPCPRISNVKDAKWYGWEQLLICPTCWHGHAEGTRLAQYAPIRGQVVQGDQICSLWSPRMRNMWDNAHNIDPLLVFAAHRKNVWVNSVTMISFIKTQQQMQLVNIQHQAMMGYIAGVGGTFQKASGWGRWVGNSAHGYQAAGDVAMAGHYQQASSMISSGMGSAMMDSARIAELEAAWAAVE